MVGHSTIRHRKGTLRRWFGPNRSTHWSIAGSVAVIMLGSYLIYSSRDSNPPTATTAPVAPAPLSSEK
jgi:hypothetical protein